MHHIASSFKLPNGSTLKNRIAKSAMSENYGTAYHAPSKGLIHAYRVWAKGNPGLLITGNVMIDSKALGEARNVVVEDYKHFDSLKAWAQSVNGSGVHLWPQINHPGRQAFAAINRRIVAPSAVSLKMGGASKMFKTPTPLKEQEIWDIIKRFGTTARIMKEAGFTGCQIHGAHGYLVSQFLSPNSNIREDQWGGSLENRARFVIEIYREIRRQVGSDYPIGIKINSADFQRGGFTEEESMKVIQLLGNEGIDLIEISGGTYERPAMIKGQRKKSTEEREAYFLEYIKKARKLTNTPLMLTGGFRSVSVMEEALQSNQLDIIGLARPFCLYPNLANQIFDGSVQQFNAPIPKIGIDFLDKLGGVELPWYELQIHRLGKGKTPKRSLPGILAFWFSLKSLFLKSFWKN
ncbi:MAG: NADH:flavin oxidoreductase/NADH oxidase family protein [Flavobacteriaceae bacterium]|nr:NADH:flavin oxidoreductase/NADH oxidase family protein [Flavobacteriaceae bacterium]MDG2350632.1 NADH:flavin oxidoreductase/NADH oxidase family protein [Flavobacteriaceae bacterium]